MSADQAGRGGRRQSAKASCTSRRFVTRQRASGGRDQRGRDHARDRNCCRTLLHGGPGTGDATNRRDPVLCKAADDIRRVERGRWSDRDGLCLYDRHGWPCRPGIAPSRPAPVADWTGRAADRSDLAVIVLANACDGCGRHHEPRARCSGHCPLGSEMPCDRLAALAARGGIQARSSGLQHGRRLAASVGRCTGVRRPGREGGRLERREGQDR